MKRIMAIALAAALALFALCGCGEKPAVDEPADDPAPSRIRPLQIQPKFDKSSPDDGFTLHIDALDENGMVMWSYDSPRSVPTELDTLEYWGVFGDLVVINEQNLIVSEASASDLGIYPGRLRALDIYTGSVVWTNYDYFAASTVRTYDETTGIIYSCGHYGPDCCAVDRSGNVLWLAYNEAGYMWPYEIKLEDSWITVTFEGTQEDDEGGPFEGSFTYDGEPIMG